MAICRFSRRALLGAGASGLTLPLIPEAFSPAFALSRLAWVMRFGTTLSCHTNDWMTSFYVRTPGGFLVEYGWGGRLIEPATWQPARMNSGPSLWGHDRHWLGPEAVAKGREMRRAAAVRGERAPVQVLPCNHSLMPGAYPWLDGLRGTVE